MDNYVAALFLPHTDLGQFPKLKARLAERKALRRAADQADNPSKF
jgi:hypothetical protein